jgi:hypothetical protein
MSTAKLVAPILAVAMLAILLLGGQSASAVVTQRAFGDVDCSGSVTPATPVTPVDALKIARLVIGLTVSQEVGCPPTATPVQVNGNAAYWFDVDCNGSISIRDAQIILLSDAGLAYSQTPGCPPIGATVQEDH